MAFCRKCGTEMPVHSHECPACHTQEKPSFMERLADKAEHGIDVTDRYTKEEIDENTPMAVLAYIPVLCLIPLFIELSAKKSFYLRFHLNQGLVLFLTELMMGLLVEAAGFFLGKIWYPLEAVMHILTALLGVGFLVLTVIGVMTALHKKARELPLFGSLTIIKSQNKGDSHG